MTSCADAVQGQGDYRSRIAADQEFKIRQKVVAVILVLVTVPVTFGSLYYETLHPYPCSNRACVK